MDTKKDINKDIRTLTLRICVFPLLFNQILLIVILVTVFLSFASILNGCGHKERQAGMISAVYYQDAGKISEALSFTLAGSVTYRRSDLNAGKWINIDEGTYLLRESSTVELSFRKNTYVKRARLNAGGKRPSFEWLGNGADRTQ